MKDIKAKLKKAFIEFYLDHEEFCFNVEMRWFLFKKYYMPKIKAIHCFEDLWNIILPVLHGVAPVVFFLVLFYTYILDAESKYLLHKFLRRFGRPERRLTTFFLIVGVIICYNYTFCWNQFREMSDLFGGGVIVYIVGNWLFLKVSILFKYLLYKFKYLLYKFKCFLYKFK